MAKRKKGHAREKDIMGGGKFTKMVLAPCLLVIIGSCIFLFWWINNRNSTYTNIDYIRSFMTQSGTLNDYQNKIAMWDPETDLRWYKTDKEIRIEFGRIVLTWEPADFYTKENLEHLATIGITAEIKENKDGTKILKLYYHGEEIERWIK